MHARSGFGSRAAIAIAMLGVAACVLEVDVVSPTGSDTDPVATAETAAESSGFDTVAHACNFPGGNACDFQCGDGERCRTECGGHSCVTTCIDAELCEIDCQGGPCYGSCEVGDVCELACPRGACSLDCSGTRECVVSCPGGGCNLTCSDVERCEIVECERDCMLTCGGAPDCASSCGFETGCTTLPD